MREGVPTRSARFGPCIVWLEKEEKKEVSGVELESKLLVDASLK